MCRILYILIYQIGYIIYDSLNIYEKHLSQLTLCRLKSTAHFSQKHEAHLFMIMILFSCRDHRSQNHIYCILLILWRKKNLYWCQFELDLDWTHYIVWENILSNWCGDDDFQTSTIWCGVGIVVVGDEPKNRIFSVLDR